MTKIATPDPELLQQALEHMRRFAAGEYPQLMDGQAQQFARVTLEWVDLTVAALGEAQERLAAKKKADAQNERLRAALHQILPIAEQRAQFSESYYKTIAQLAKAALLAAPEPQP